MKDFKNERKLLIQKYSLMGFKMIINILILLLFSNKMF